MSTQLRIVGFLAVLAVIFAATYGVGKLFDEENPTYRLKLTSTTADQGKAPVSFRIEEDGKPVTRFAVRHEKRLHLIAVRDDFTGFQHVHPTMATDGTWSTELGLEPGKWRLYGDFQPGGGTKQVATADLTVPGSVPSVVDQEVTRTAVVDGYQVSLGGDLVAGGEGSMLEFRVTKAGRPVTLQPYLGAFGHLVVLRGKDMKYLHVHPEDGPAGSTVSFHAEVPTAGRYHLYLDFKHGDVVRTATFVLDATRAPTEHDEMGGMDHGDH